MDRWAHHRPPTACWGLKCSTRDPRCRSWGSCSSCGSQRRSIWWRTTPYRPGHWRSSSLSRCSPGPWWQQLDIRFLDIELVWEFCRQCKSCCLPFYYCLIFLIGLFWSIYCYLSISLLLQQELELHSLSRCSPPLCLLSFGTSRKCFHVGHTCSGWPLSLDN